MIQISNTIDIALSPSQVFKFLADVDNNPKWMPVQSVEKVTLGSIGTGFKFRQRFMLMGKTYDMSGVITAFEPDKKISFNYESPVFDWRGDYLLEPIPTGTRLSAKGNVSLVGAMKMMETMFAPKIRKLIGDTAPKLKQILES